MKKYFPVALIILLAACNSDDKKVEKDEPVNSGVPAPKMVKVNVLNHFPHDTSSFTEGLQIYNGKLYEGSGDFENSALQIADLKTGKVLQQHKMGTAQSEGGGIFGEGINVFKGKIYQLTWQNHIVYVYDEKDITKPIKTFPWRYEGWGMTNDGTNLIISDGKQEGYLYFVNPDSFNVVKTISVQTNNGPVNNLNELEYIDGYIYANIWNTNTIVKADPVSGNVITMIDCSNLLQQYAPGEVNDPKFDHQSNVLNGIAYDSSSKKMYITGKRWPKLFEVSLN